MKIFSDSASMEDIKRFSNDPRIDGFTTNPSLLKKAGVTDYFAFIKEAVIVANNKPISFEVIGDDEASMEQQAAKISALGNNVYVKIPVMNTLGQKMGGLINRLSTKGIKLNVTAILTTYDALMVVDSLYNNTPSIISVFAGRIADTGIDPTVFMKEIKHQLSVRIPSSKELLWASSREIFNYVQAKSSGCDIITLAPNLIDKLKLIGYDLDALTMDTIKMFYNDAVASGLSL